MANKKIILPYDEATKQIKTGDVLLFKAPPFPSIGWWITKYTGGKHSHVALAMKESEHVFCVEQREFKGGRAVNLKTQVEQNPSRIDIYRPKDIIVSNESVLTESNKEFFVKKVEYRFTPEIAKRILDTGLELTGTSYGWKTIWNIFKGYAPFVRLVYRDKNGDDEITKAYVCSTLVTYAYRTNFLDPCPNIKDARTTPADIAQSSLFDYLFTIE